MEAAVAVASDEVYPPLPALLPTTPSIAPNIEVLDPEDDDRRKTMPVYFPKGSNPFAWTGTYQCDLPLVSEVDALNSSRRSDELSSGQLVALAMIQQAAADYEAEERYLDKIGMRYSQRQNAGIRLQRTKEASGVYEQQDTSEEREIDAHEWVASDDDSYVLSFVNCCETLKISPIAARELIQSGQWSCGKGTSLRQRLYAPRDGSRKVVVKTREY